ncbi:cyclase family protein [Rhizobium sp. VS19-DR104.2]|uniref:cyclase family protein n=1 Tax=unclassified Rhizobium TaxID=2613769 RepID=UPI001CC3B0E2|nr:MULTISPECIES: cyclase family protein [unclassified Rhizobium]MBZ5763153.1 cyclase family protein [Rhizobium sp. VS19-DR96]MBZ5769069.1 cyclase family protein [Rhizobium sp. VS19-DR129.2]MBZ5776642.1 cyclase family protein [Rhizobium sp. VS19-DRK62.2]MBZ5787772.1 cyclase family protein [Rhizobium sp. VS19-DR121]MBZ5805140.1 cyclase family protein [Rhizobium sp. VS19-DR181]
MDNLTALFRRDRFRFIDLTHPLKEGMPVWPTHPAFCQEVIESYDNGDVACNHSLCLSEHSGTHFDAPLHFIKGDQSIAEISLEQFFGRMATIDAKDCAPCEAVTIDRILEFEDLYGPIEAGDAVFFHFGWDRYWNDASQQDCFLKDWPGLSQGASEFLQERSVRIVGSDCLSIDCYGSSNFPAHNILLGGNILIGENFANLGQLPPYCFLVALPLPIAGGSGSPARAVALVEIEMASHRGASGALHADMNTRGKE